MHLGCGTDMAAFGGLHAISADDVVKIGTQRAVPMPSLPPAGSREAGDEAGWEVLLARQLAAARAARNMLLYYSSIENPYFSARTKAVPVGH